MDFLTDPEFIALMNDELETVAYAMLEKAQSDELRGEDLEVGEMLIRILQMIHDLTEKGTDDLVEPFLEIGAYVIHSAALMKVVRDYIEANGGGVGNDE